ncbi:MAG: hypothetical protein KGN02_14795 [bacterium]|nr:hypothetical protein [bacterium]
MKRRSLFAALLAMLVPALAVAQVPGATPTPDPMVYDDPAIHFQAPSGWYPVGQRRIKPDDLGSNPEAVAGWVNSSTGRVESLVLQLQSFSGSLDDFETTYEQEMRQEFSGTFIKNKERTSLANGMPAYYMEMTTGEGFTTTKAFIVIWIDGVRGVALVVNGPLDNISANVAKAIMRKAKATQYPLGRDY